MAVPTKRISSLSRRPAVPAPAKKPADTIATGDEKPEGVPEQTWQELKRLSGLQKQAGQIRATGKGPVTLTPFEMQCDDVVKGRKRIEDMPAEFQTRYNKALAATEASTQQALQKATEEAMSRRPFQDEPPSIESLPTDRQTEIRQILAEADAYRRQVTAAVGADVPEPPAVTTFEEAAEIEAATPIAAEEATAPAALPPAEPATHFCMRCGWNQSYEFPSYFTEDDRETYVQTTLGGKRFVKTYQLFGGRASVTFRALSPKEDSMALRQMAVDAVKDDAERKLQTSDSYVQTLTTYRMFMGIESLTLPGQGVIEVPPIAEIEVEPSAFTYPDLKIKAVADRLMDVLFATSELHHVVMQAYIEFDRVCAALRVAAQQRDF